MSQRTQDLRNRVADGLRFWKINVTLPYSSAYATAYEQYQKVLKEQAEADKARAELFVSMASIVGGSLLMATIGQTTLRAAVADVALNAICQRNLVWAFNAMAVTESNKTVMFALNKVLDIVKDQSGKAIKDRATEILSSGSTIQTSNPQVKQNDLEAQLLKHEAIAVETADRVESDHKLTALEKDRAFAELQGAPICRHPSRSIDAPTLAKKIELCIYMQAVLDSDELIDWPAYYGQPNRHPTGSHPIPQLPSAADYPHPRPAHAGDAQQSIGFHTLGGNVQARVDTLHNELFHSNFFIRDPLLWNPFNPPRSPGQNRSTELRLAETRIDDLARIVRPDNILAVRY